MAENPDAYVPAGGALDGIDIVACFKRACTLQILVCGKTGVGKSSLINSLVGFQVREVGDPGATDGGESLDGCTTAVAATWVNVDGVFVAIYDSPGLQDGGPGEKKYLDNMYDKCKDVDLVLFCVDMTAPRYNTADIQTTELLTKKFGQAFWEHCVLVMTKADRVRVPRSERGKERAYHQRLYTNLLQKFRQQLIKQRVPEATADAIPAVAAGLYDPDVGDADPDNERYIWYVSDKAEPSDQPVDFLTELWVTCFETMRGSAQENFMRATMRQRVKPASQLTEDEQQLSQLLEEREKKERDMRNDFEQKLREREGNFERELESLKEEFRDIPQAPPPPYDDSWRFKFQDEQLARVRVAFGREDAVQAAATTTVGAVTGALAGGVIAGPLGMCVGAAVGGILGFRMFRSVQSEQN